MLIRIYDLNWKGLWRCCCNANFNRSSYQNLWPELEGIVTNLIRLSIKTPWFIRIYDLNWKGLWLCPDHLYYLPPPLSEFMTWIGRDCDSGRAIPRRNGSLRGKSEFMTWIGRDCDPPCNIQLRKLFFCIRIYDLNWKGLWLALGVIFDVFDHSSEFMTWIGRDCDPSRKACRISSRVNIRIYDLNWKGLWLIPSIHSATVS